MKRRGAKKHDAFWASVAKLKFTSEASVESRLVEPLLHAIGYEVDHIESKHPVEAFVGGVGRKQEADFAVFSGEPHDDRTSLFVVEAKKPSEKIGDPRKGRRQAEFYANALRAPLLIITNGIDFQVWQYQPTRPSDRVISCKVTDLAAKRGEIETLLRRDAVVSLCKSLSLKTLHVDAIPMGGYLDAELNRTATPLRTVSRMLHRVPAVLGDAVRSTELMEQSPRPVTILAPSGYGKTTLCRQLLLQRIEACLAGKSNCVPVEVPLPEVGALKTTILGYARGRVSAHVPALGTKSAFSDLLSRRGCLLLCDALERVDDRPRRDALIVEIRTIVRDFPQCQVVVFARPSVNPSIEAAATYELREFTDDEQREVRDASGLSFDVTYGIRDLLWRLCRIPVILQATLDHCRRHQQAPTDLVTLFDTWISDRLAEQAPGARRLAQRRSALEVIAQCTSSGCTALEDVLSSLQERSLPAALIDELRAVDILASSTRTVAFVHEVFADFVLAKVISRADSAMQLATQLAAVRLDADSVLPVFLAAQLADPALQRALWNLLIDRDLRTYMNALHYRADTSHHESVQDHNAYSKWFLGEVCDGLCALITRRFPAIKTVVLPELGSDPNTASVRCGIVGTLSRDRAHVGYRIVPVSTDEPLVRVVPVGEVRGPGRTKGVNLQLSQLREDSGRYLGTMAAKEALHDAAKNQRFRGGNAWSAMRLLASLETLSAATDMQFDTWSLEQLEDWLAKQRPTTFWMPGSIDIWTDDLLEDVRAMQRLGDVQPGTWRLPSPDLQDANAPDHWPSRYSDERLAEFIRERYRRALLAYREIAERSLRGVLSHLRHYPQLPMRLDIRMYRSKSWSGELEPHIEFYHVPVASWDEGVVGVECVNGPTIGQTLDELEALRDQLVALGRPIDVVSTGGSTWVLPESDYGSSMVGLVCGWLKEDISHLFREA